MKNMALEAQLGPSERFQAANIPVLISAKVGN